MKQKCEICGKKIKTQIFRNTGVCSGNCEKRRAELSDPPERVQP